MKYLKNTENTNFINEAPCKDKDENYCLIQGWNSEITFVLIAWFLIGTIIGALSLLLFKNVGIFFMITIPTIFGITSLFIGWEKDFFKIPPENMVAVYNSVSKSPLFNASGTSLWKRFGLRKIGKLHNRTVNPFIIDVLSSVTKDDVEVDVIVKANYQLNNAILFEVEVGDDYKEILEADLYNTADGSIKSLNLDVLEKNIKEGDIQKELEEDLSEIFNKHAFTLLKVIMYKPQTDASIKKARQAPKIAKYEAKAKAIVQSEKDKIVMKSLKGLKKFYEELNMLDQFNIASAKKDIMVQMDEYSDEKIIAITGVGGNADIVEALIAGFLGKK